MKNILRIPEQKTPHFSMPPHTITSEGDLSSLQATLSSEDLTLFLKLYEEAQYRPKAARKEVEHLLKRNPHHPEVLNLLTYILLQLRKVRLANHLILENYRLNPDYLLAKLNYADLCLRKNRLNEIPLLFKEKWNLQHLYPARKLFHLSEFRGFMVVMARYHLAIKKVEAAECYFYLAHTVDGKHPSVKLLKKQILNLSFKDRIKKCFNRIKQGNLL